MCVSAGLILALTSFLPVEDQGSGRGMTMSKHIGSASKRRAVL